MAKEIKNEFYNNAHIIPCGSIRGDLEHLKQYYKDGKKYFYGKYKETELRGYKVIWKDYCQTYKDINGLLKEKEYLWINK